MPRPALTDEQRSATRRKIRKVAAELYAQNGFADISARKIAEAAGVSVGTLYAYFDNLTQLMQSLWKEPAARMIEDLVAVQQRIDDPLDRLRALLETYAQFAVDQRPVYRGAFLFVRPASHDKPTQVSLDDDRIFRVFRDTIQAGQQQGLFRAGDLNQLTQALWAGLHGAIALPLNIDRLALDDREASVRQMIELLLEWITV